MDRRQIAQNFDQRRISDFTILKLKDIAEQRALYSSIDDIVYADDLDSDYDEPVDLATPRQKLGRNGEFFKPHILKDCRYKDYSVRGFKIMICTLS